MDNYGVQNGVQNGEQLEKPLSLGEWLITLIVLGIPCVGFIMMFVWGFGQGNKSRRNYCRAALILSAVAIVLVLIFYASLAAVLVDTLSSYSY